MKKPNIIKIVHGQGVTKNIGNYESIRVYNELEASIVPGEDIKETQASLRKGVELLNAKDLAELLGG